MSSSNVKSFDDGSISGRVTSCSIVLGFTVVIFVVVIMIITTIVYIKASDENQTNETMLNIKKKIDEFTNGRAEKLYTKFYKKIAPQPLVFTKQLNSYPDYCTPHSGCFYPSYSDANKKKIWCEKAWRDCNAYQDCTDGLCVPKPKT